MLPLLSLPDGCLSALVISGSEELILAEDVLIMIDVFVMKQESELVGSKNSGFFSLLHISCRSPLDSGSLVNLEFMYQWSAPSLYQNPGRFDQV